MAEESFRLVSGDCSLDEFGEQKENRNTSSKSQRKVLLLKIIIVSRNDLKETENISARDLDKLIANFPL